MVPLIEDQIHQALKAQEEDRCRRLEAQYARNEATKNKKVKRREIAKPWSRPGPQALCQDTDLLLLVSEYDYDLSRPDFQAYCRSRGILYMAGTPGTTRWEYSEHYGTTKAEFLDNPYFQYAQEVNGQRHRFTQDDMETQWRITCLARAQLQDCWELFSQGASRVEG
jgi:hypothetical protein